MHRAGRSGACNGAKESVERVCTCLLVLIGLQTVVAVAALGSIRSGQSKRCTELYGTVTVRKKGEYTHGAQPALLRRHDAAVGFALPLQVPSGPNSVLPACT